MRWAIPPSSRVKLTCVVTLQGGFHELHNEPEFKDGLIMKAIEWTLKRIDTPNQAGSSSQKHPISDVQPLPAGIPADGGADKPKL